MKIEILGSGNGFESSLGNTSFLAWNDSETEAALMDCGYTVFPILREMERNNPDLISKIKTVFISHMHDDHAGSAGIFALFRKNILKRLERGNEITRFIGIDIRPLFDLVIKGSPDVYEYDYSKKDFELIETTHGSEMPTCGILMNDVMYSGDTAKSLLETEFAQRAKIIIHEATLRDGPHHTNFESLLSAPVKIRAKTWLIHNSVKHLDEGFEEIVKKEGFAGICKRGQVIQF